MDGRDRDRDRDAVVGGWAAFFRETQGMLEALGQLEGLMSGRLAVPPPRELEPSSVSPRQRLLSPEYLQEQQQQQQQPSSSSSSGVDLNGVPGGKDNVYSDFEPEPAPSRSFPSSFRRSPDADQRQGLGFGGLLEELFRMGMPAGVDSQAHSISSSTRYDSATGETETVVRATHRVNGQTVTCVQRFWENLTTHRRRQEGACHDAQGKRIEPQLEKQLLAQASAPFALY